MKKLITALCFAVALVLCSCAKDPIGGTKVQNVSGEWQVKAYLIDADGEIIDTYDDATFHVMTYNTSENDADKMYIDSYENADYAVDFSLGSGYYFYRAIVNVDTSTKEFSVENAEEDYTGEILVTIDGKITEKGIETPSGAAADKIEFTVYAYYADDPDTNVLTDCWDYWEYPDYYDGAEAVAVKYVGWRYTGLVSDEDDINPVDF